MSHILAQLKARLLADATVLDLLYNRQAVYVEGEDYSKPEGPDAEPWTRLVIVPAQSLWPDDGAPGLVVPKAFVLRAECNNFTAPQFNPQLALEGLLAAAQLSLQGYVPPAVVGFDTKVVFPIYLQRVMEPRILWYDIAKVWFLSVEYRMEVSSG
jgi:hypothetical protein